MGLKKLVTACYRNQERALFGRHDSERAIWLEYAGNAMPLALQAFYPDKREAKRSHQFATHDPATLQATLRDWYEKALAELIAIGEDAI